MLEALVECLELQTGVDCPGLPDLFPFPVEPHFSVLYHRRGFLVLRILQSSVSERTAVTSVLIRQVGTGVMRTHGTMVGRVSQRATVRRGPGGEGPIVLRGPDGVQSVDRIMVVG